jgi:hypothetical protein
MYPIKEFAFFYKGNKRISVICEEDNKGFLLYPVSNGQRIHDVETYITNLDDLSCERGVSKLIDLLSKN